MAVEPDTAKPIPKPTIPCSHNGVLKTRSLPKISKNIYINLQQPTEKLR